jgi:hypothetical protein
MHRTEGDNNTQVGGENRFTDGPPGTTVGSSWLNSVQEEICDVIEGAGLALYNESNDIYGQLRAAILQTVPFPRGYIDGFIMSNEADADHDIGISVGKCRDENDSLSISLSAAITKQIDAVWAAGTNQGGFPSGLGVVAIDTWYHVFVISKTDGITSDAGFDTSLTATNLLADAGAEYTVYRRVGSVLTDGAANIIEFYQYGDNFFWKNPPLDVNGAATGVVVNNITLSTPNGVRTLAKFNWRVGTSDGSVYWKTTDVDDEAPDTALAPLASLSWSNSTTSPMGAYMETITSLASVVNVRTSINQALYVSTIGWQDFRGKDA